MKIEGEHQSLISKNASSLLSIGNKSQFGHEDECQVIHVNSSAYRDLATNTGHMSVSKLIDGATPLLSLALNNGEKLNIEISFYRHTGVQSYDLYFKTIIQKAYVTQQNIIMGNQSSESDHETLTIRYTDIRHNHVTSNSHGYILWSNE
jgi:hypothetical protein